VGALSRGGGEGVARLLLAPVAGVRSAGRGRPVPWGRAAREALSAVVHPAGPSRIRWRQSGLPGGSGV